jgi:leader peptidase (prepilin peptidase)/N-methyltransferase
MKDEGKGMNMSIASSFFFIHPSSFLLHPFSFILPPSSLILLLWLFAMGAAIGSFLNVVVYRLPRGISLVHPGSHCPACKKPIRWYDNVPIFGWFLLRGRCRDCKGRISFRYPLVEAITAVMFLAVGVVEGFSDGTDGGLAILVAYHLVLLSTLLATGLIEYDGQRPPWRLMLPALVIGAVALVWPLLRSIADSSDWPQRIVGLVDGGIGFAIGIVLGLAMVRRSPRVATRGLETRALGPACVGLFLGVVWLAAIALLTIWLLGAASVVGRKWPVLLRLSPSLFLTAATFAWILAWNNLMRPSVW